MIIARVPLNNLEYTIYKPLITSVVKSFSIKYLKDPDPYLTFTADADVFGSGMYDTDYSTQYQKRFIDVTYEVRHDDEGSIVNSIRFNDGLVLFDDKDLKYFKIFGEPISHTFNLTLKIRSRFKNELKQLLNHFQMGQIDDVNYLVTDADVFFSIPNNLLDLVRNICYLKYNDEELWFKYFTKFSTIELDFLNSKSGKKQLPIYRIKYKDLAIPFSAEFLDKEIEREDGWFSIEIGLRFNLDIITSLKVQYPILVANRPIEKRFIIIPDRLIESVALPIERSLYNDKLINTYLERVNNLVYKKMRELMNTIDVDKYIKIFKDIEDDYDILFDYKKKIEELHSLDKNVTNYNKLKELILEAIHKDISKYLDTFYRLKNNLKRVYPIYDIWRNYLTYNGYEVINVLLLRISPRSMVYLNLYELLNLGYSKDVIDYIIDNHSSEIFKLKGSVFHMEIYIDDLPYKYLEIVKEDTYIEDLDLELKRGDLIDKRILDHNLNNEDRVYIDLRPVYHLVIRIANDFRNINYKVNTEYFSVLGQFFAIRDIENYYLMSDRSIMKTINALTITALSAREMSPLLLEAVKDMNKE